MLKLMLAVLLISVGFRVLATGPLPSKHVDLSDPGAITRIRDSNPAQYRKIQKIVSGLANHRESEVPKWLKTSFKAKAVSYSYSMLTTSPGQRDLSFVLDDTLYYGRVISTQAGGTVFLIGNK